MKRRTHATPPRAGDDGEVSSRSKFLDAGRAWRWGGAALLALAVWLTYQGSLAAPFIFDDVPTIVGNLSLRRLWPLVSFSGEMSPLQALPQTAVYGRPLVNLSLALNYHFGQLDPRGYRGTNIVLHVLAAIVLAAVVRRTLRLDFFEGRFAGVVEPISLAAALVWALHPLDIESVAYVTQRTELMMGLCYLLTLYASQLYWSATGSKTRAQWLVLAVVACQLGMLSKETIASAPAMVLLYERTFLAGSFKRALRNSWPLYLGLLSSWLTFLALNIHGPSTPAVGFGLGIPALSWWFTQCKVLFLYLKLVVWPWPLVIHYEIPRLDTFSQAWPWVVPAALLAAAVVVLVLRRTTLGFVGTWVFAVLSPTLLVPLIIEVAAERRMYVPLMAIVPLVVVGGYALLVSVLKARARRVSSEGMPKPLVYTLIAAVVLACGYSALDLRRLAVFADTLSFWADAESNQPDSPLVQLNLGGALMHVGRRDEAIAHYQRAVELNPALFAGQYRLAEALQSLGRDEEAEQALEKAIRSNPEMAAAHYGLAQLLHRRGEWDRAKRNTKQRSSGCPISPRPISRWLYCWTKPAKQRKRDNTMNRRSTCRRIFPPPVALWGSYYCARGSPARRSSNFVACPPRPMRARTWRSRTGAPIVPPRR